MLYFRTDENMIIILEPDNIPDLKSGFQLFTPDGLIEILFTPDPEWLVEQLMKHKGLTAGMVNKDQQASISRPEVTNRPFHGIMTLIDSENEKKEH